MSPYDVVPADPDSLSAAPSPVSRPPDVIGPPDVIPGAMRVIRPIANLDRDGAWVSGVPWTVTWAIWTITSVIWPAVRRISTVIIGASAYAHYD